MKILTKNKLKQTEIIESAYDALKRTAMHYRAISQINLPKTYDDAILAQFVVHYVTDSNRTVRVE